MNQHTRLWILDANIDRRNRVYTLGMSAGYISEPFESVDELAEFAPTSGIILVPSRSGLSREVMHALDRCGIWLPLVQYGPSPSATEIVRAVFDGAAGFLPWPFTPAELDEASALALAVEPWGIADVLSPTKASANRSSARRRLESLTPRELEILDLVLEGKSNNEAGSILGISPRTIEIHRSNAMQKLGVRRVAEAMRIVLEAKFMTEQYSRPLRRATDRLNQARNVA